jgi:hypothetical protein
MSTRIFINLALLLGVVFGTTSCGGWKPFQPPPDLFESFIKEGVAVEGTKQEMRRCGFANLYYGRQRGDTDNEIAARENCMFTKGFTYLEGYRGMCSLKRGRDLPACK